MKNLAVLALAAWLPLSSAAADLTYINRSPDKRYSANGDDSRIVFVTDRNLYGYGHNLGQTEDCSTTSHQCLSFSFMAVMALPVGVKVNDTFIISNFTFKVTEKTKIGLVGHDYEVFKVDVSRAGEASNSYYFNASLGVVAIEVYNFGNENIPASFFLLRESRGLFGINGKNGKNRDTHKSVVP